MEGGNYKFGTKLRVSCQGDPYILFKGYHMKASGRCVNYNKYQINESLSQYNYVIFGVFQANNPDSSSGDEFYCNTITMWDEIQFEGIHAYSEDSNGKFFLDNENAYASLKEWLFIYEKLYMDMKYK